MPAAKSWCRLDRTRALASTLHQANLPRGAGGLGKPSTSLGGNGISGLCQRALWVSTERRSAKVTPDERPEGMIGR
jgi:hypothetical protein